MSNFANPLFTRRTQDRLSAHEVEDKRDDRLCRHTVVQGPRDHHRLGELQQGCGCLEVREEEPAARKASFAKSNLWDEERVANPLHLYLSLRSSTMQYRVHPRRTNLEKASVRRVQQRRAAAAHLRPRRPTLLRGHSGCEET